MIPPADAASIGAKSTIADLSSATAHKQIREHPELTPQDYARAQDVIDHHTHKIQDTERSLIYVLDESARDSGGYVLVVKATRTARGLCVTSYRRLHRAEAVRDREIARLLDKGRG